VVIVVEEAVLTVTVGLADKVVRRDLARLDSAKRVNHDPKHSRADLILSQAISTGDFGVAAILAAVVDIVGKVLPSGMAVAVILEMKATGMLQPHLPKTLMCRPKQSKEFWI
jgi:hypothetical protein